jgi:hypothetical protein
MKQLRLLIILASLGALVGCPTPNGAPTYTLQGTVTLDEGIYLATGNLVAAVTQGSDSFSVSVPVGTPIAGIYTWNYSIAGVPAGSYTISLSFRSDTQQYFNGLYDFNGAGFLGVTVQEGVPDFTYTVSSPPNTTLNADSQLDVQIVFNGVP